QLAASRREQRVPAARDAVVRGPAHGAAVHDVAAVWERAMPAKAGVRAHDDVGLVGVAEPGEERIRAGARPHELVLPPRRAMADEHAAAAEREPRLARE